MVKKSTAKPAAEERKYRNFPKHTLEDALVLPQKIYDEMGGKPMKRLLLAGALGISPSGTNFRDLLSSSFKYGLTEGTEKAPAIQLTPVGDDATQGKDQTKRLKALRSTALAPDVFQKFMNAYADKKLPSREMMSKILATEYGVPSALADECRDILVANGQFVDLIREISGSAHVLLDTEVTPAKTGQEIPVVEAGTSEEEEPSPPPAPTPTATSTVLPPKEAPRAIFVGHGKKKAPLQQLQKILTSFQIPHKVVTEEANLGRPISQKVKDTMLECGSAILIFSRDEKFFDAEKNEVWRPSENVVHELGAASFAYGDRIVIFKEKGLHFPTNFQNIGYIEFEEEGLEARTTDLLKELIGFGLVKVTTG